MTEYLRYPIYFFWFPDWMLNAIFALRQELNEIHQKIK